MRRLLALCGLFLMSGCAGASLLPSSRSEVAVATEARQERVNWDTDILVRPQQVLVPLRADGRDEFCSTTGSLFGGTGRPLPMCFYDQDGDGRFDTAYLPRQRRTGDGIKVNIPYTLRPFPCSNCVPPTAELTRISDPQMLADHSIAPINLRPYVQVALANPADLEATIARSSLPDRAAAQSTVELAAREVRDRRAIDICSSQNPGVGIGIIGAIAVIAGGASQRSCMNEYMRTGAMPLVPVPVEIPTSGN